MCNVGVKIVCGLAWLMALSALAVEMCTIAGEQGACQVEAFFGPESQTDPEAYTCTKFKGVKYQGNCRDGTLDGLVLLKRPADRRWSRTSEDQFLAMVKAGQVQYPVATFAEQFVGAMGRNWSLGCVSFAQGWDTSSHKLCVLLTNAFGASIVKRETWRSVRTGKFDLKNAVWNDVSGSDRSLPVLVGGDDPKTLGRGTKGG